MANEVVDLDEIFGTKAPSTSGPTGGETQADREGARQRILLKEASDPRYSPEDQAAVRREMARDVALGRVPELSGGLSASETPSGPVDLDAIFRQVGQRSAPSYTSNLPPSPGDLNISDALTASSAPPTPQAQMPRLARGAPAAGGSFKGAPADVSKSAAILADGFLTALPALGIDFSNALESGIAPLVEPGTSQAEASDVSLEHAKQMKAVVADYIHPFQSLNTWITEQVLKGEVPEESTVERVFKRMKEGVKKLGATDAAKTVGLRESDIELAFDTALDRLGAKGTLGLISKGIARLPEAAAPKPRPGEGTTFDADEFYGGGKPPVYSESPRLPAPEGMSEPAGPTPPTEPVAPKAPVAAPVEAGPTDLVPVRTRKEAHDLLAAGRELWGTLSTGKLAPVTDAEFLNRFSPSAGEVFVQPQGAEEQLAKLDGEPPAAEPDGPREYLKSLAEAGRAWLAGRDVFFERNGEVYPVSDKSQLAEIPPNQLFVLPSPTAKAPNPADLTPVRTHMDARNLFAQGRELWGSKPGGGYVRITDLDVQNPSFLFVTKPKAVALPAGSATSPVVVTPEELALHKEIEAAHKTDSPVSMGRLLSAGAKEVTPQEAKFAIENDGIIFFNGSQGGNPFRLAHPIRTVEDLDLGNLTPLEKFYEVTDPRYRNLGKAADAANTAAYARPFTPTDSPADIAAKSLPLAKSAADGAAAAAGKGNQVRAVASLQNSETLAGALVQRLKGTMPEPEGLEGLKDAVRSGQVKTGQDLLAWVKRKYPESQSGKISWDMLISIAGLSMGFALGAWIDPENPIVGGLLGALLGYPAARIGLKATHEFIQAYKTGGAKGPRDTQVAIGDHYVHTLKRGNLVTWQRTTEMLKRAPEKADRIALYNAVERGTVSSLPPNLQAIAAYIEPHFDKLATTAAKEDLLENLRVTMVRKLWEKKDWDAANRLYTAHPPTKSSTFADKFRYARQLTSTTLGEQNGLVPKTKDIAEVFSMYSSSVFNSVAKKNLLKDYAKFQLPNGEYARRPAGKAPYYYVALKDGSAGTMWHPDIAPSVRFLLETQDAHGAMAAVNFANMAAKRGAVSYSFFHATALLQAMLGRIPLLQAWKAPFILTKFLGQAILPKVFGENTFLEQLKTAKAGSVWDLALKDGLQISLHGQESIDADVGGGSFYSGMRTMQHWIDTRMPQPFGKGFELLQKVTHMSDNFMWGRLHAALKIHVYLSAMEELLHNSAKSGYPLSRDQAGKIAADLANHVFGGLDWRRMAEGVENPIGRNFLLRLFSPEGRRGMQLGLFAPDWKISTTMAFVKALPYMSDGKGFVEGVKGLLRPKTAADLYRQQFGRSAVWYFLAAELLTLYFAGHHIWEKRKDGTIDLFTVDRGDGTKQQVSKHFTDPFHLITHPIKYALAGLGVIPSEIGAQIQHKEYVSDTPNHVPEMKNRFTHALKRFQPISAGQFGQGAERGLAGALGFPIYGKTDTQVTAEHKERREKSFWTRVNKLRVDNGLPPIGPEKYRKQK